MKNNLYSIYDTIACVFNKPFVAINHATAERSFRDSATDQPHIKDYELYYIGSYQDDSGVITCDNPPERVISGLQIKALLADEASSQNL